MKEKTICYICESFKYIKDTGCCKKKKCERCKEIDEYVPYARVIQAL